STPAPLLPLSRSLFSFLFLTPHPPSPTLFPYTTLFRSRPRRPQRHLRRLRQLRRLARRIATDVRSLRVRPRRPMNVAVDRDAIVDQVLAGQGQPATTPITDAYPEHVPIEFGPGDPAARTARAGELLSDAGWEPGPDGIRTKNGARAELSVAYHADDSVRRELAAAFADQMRPLGIAVE